VTIAQAQHRDEGEMRACRFSADGEELGAERLLALLDQPKRRRFAVVGSGGVWVFGGQPIAHRDAGKTESGEALEIGILLVRCAQGPTAAVDMKVDAAGVIGGNYPQGDGPGGAVNLDGLRPVRFRQRRKRAEAFAAALAQILDREGPLVGEH